MASLITPDLFINRPYKVPNREESQDFADFIEKEEEKLLINLLGYPLYKEFSEELSGSNVSDAFTRLRDGAEYTFYGVTCKYNGLKDLLIPAIYSRWINHVHYVFTASGYMRSQPAQENFQVLEDPELFIVAAWNDYVCKVGERYNQKNTFYGFMMANKDDYPDWQFTMPCLKNRFGL